MGRCCPGKDDQGGAEVGIEVMPAPRKGVGPLLGSPAGLSYFVGQGS